MQERAPEIREPAATSELSGLLKGFRAEAGLSQQALAEKASISVQAVSALERGYRRAPYRTTLERIADALSLPREALETLERSARRERGTRHAEQGPAHNLPRCLTSFLGREEVVADIAALLRRSPLVSIVGTGGVGKTRVAVEVGTQSLGRFSDGVWLVELAPLSDPSLVAHALAEALRVQESAQRPLIETLLAYLARKRALIVLDNCEHVLSEARTVAGTLLRDCPNLTVLTTSREALGIAGEQVYHMPTLSVPAHGTASPDEAAKSGAVALFIDRMRAVDSRFALNGGNVKPIVEICRRLDGLPLALELAAARGSVLSPQDICDRLDRVFELSSRDRQAVPRHATMRAVIDWSYELLSSAARLLFERIAAFAGGFTLETATAVCADEDIPAHDILEALSSLVAQSLVTVDFADGATRYRMLEASRQYALERLGDGPARRALTRRHALALLDVALRLDRDWYGASERAWFRDARAELDNFRVALGWALGERHDARAGRLLAGTLARVWYSLAPVEGRRWVRMALDSITQETRADELAQLYIADAELCGALGESAASLASAEQALRLGRTLDDLQAARAEHAAGSALAAIGRSREGEELLRKTLAAAQRLGNRRLQALVSSDLGTTRSRCGDANGARTFYARAISLYAALGLDRPAASIAGHLAEVEFEAGDPAAALHRAEEARAGHSATGNRRSEVADLTNMAAYLVALNCFDDARRHAMQALQSAQEIRVPVLIAFALQHLAAVAALQEISGDTVLPERLERAAMLLGFVDARLAALGARRDFTERQEYERVVTALRDALGERFAELGTAGALWTEETAARAIC